MNVALVTGGSAGLGRALTGALVARGWHVVVDGRDRDALQLVAGELGPLVVPVAGDVTDAAHRTALMEAVSRLGRLDLLVNNASTLGESPLPALADLPLDVYRRVLEVNLVAPLGLVQLLLPVLVEAGGAVVNVTSDAAVEPYETWGGYGSSQAGLEQLSNVLAAEEPGVRVWWFDPGDMRTRMHQDAFPGEDISDRPPPEAVVPAVLRLLDERPPSGRVRAADLLAGAGR
jgi:NAD(P)-dependent dehydrogenase (short-subunit alcohol dehydrogenase family)